MVCRGLEGCRRFSASTIQPFSATDGRASLIRIGLWLGCSSPYESALWVGPPWQLIGRDALTMRHC